MKFAIFTVMLPEWEPQIAVEKLAGYGYDGVEWRVTNTAADARGQAPSFWGNNLCTIRLDEVLSRAEELRDMTNSAGLETAALAGYRPIEDYEAVGRLLEAARIMGAPLIRAGAPRYDGSVHHDRLFEKARADFENMAPKALEAGVKICLETHMGIISASASAARRLLDGLDPEAVGVIYDPGNMVTEGYEETKMGLEILGPYLAHVHAKNGAWMKKEKPEPGEHPWSPSHHAALDEGIVDWKKVITDLKAVGYDGYISFEDFSSVRETEEKVAFNIEYLKSLL